MASNQKLYVPPAGKGARDQINALRKAHRPQDADLIQAMVDQPSAVWFEGGTPEDIRKDVKTTMRRAAAQKHSIPVLVSYNIPYRDCSQYSEGGASGTEEYNAWIDGFAAGLGKGPAIVILEPDSLGHHPLVQAAQRVRHLRVVPARGLARTSSRLTASSSSTTRSTS